jgi:thioredoxin 1
MSEFLKTYDDANWDDQVLNSNQLTVVDVWAPWCGPCRVIGPIIEELSVEYHDKINVGKLNADESRIPGQLGIAGIPTILFFMNGREVDRVIGAVPKQHLVDKIEMHIKSPIMA